MSDADSDDDLFGETDGRSAAALFGVTELIDGPEGSPLLSTEALAAYLSKCPEKIKLSDQSVGDDGAVELAAALSGDAASAASVLSLDMERAELRDAGLMALAAAFGGGAAAQLESLTLSRNRFGPSGVCAGRAATKRGVVAPRALGRGLRLTANVPQGLMQQTTAG